MRVLVLGGTKFIGPFVVRSLHGMGCEIAVFHRGQSQADLPGDIQYILGDRNALEDFAPAFHAFAPDVVLDMRPLGEADSQRVMNVFTGKARRVVMVSSVDVYRNYDVLRGKEPDPADPAPLTEDSPLRPQLYPYREPGIADPNDFRNVYDKILAERVYLSDPNLPGTVLRLPFVYGLGDYQHRLWTYLKRMDDGRPAIVLADECAQWRSGRCYVENVGHAVALAVVNDRAANRVYNVAEPEGWTEQEWITLIGRAAKWNGQIDTRPNAGLPPSLQCEGNMAAHLTTSSQRLRDELGYQEVVAQDEALARTVVWERANPPGQSPPDAFDYEAEDQVISG